MDDTEMESYCSVEDVYVLNQVFGIFKEKFKDEFTFLEDWDSQFEIEDIGVLCYTKNKKIPDDTATTGVKSFSELGNFFMYRIYSPFGYVRTVSNKIHIINIEEEMCHMKNTFESYMKEP